MIHYKQMQFQNMNYTDFFTNICALCTRINRPPDDLGFNPFALMSDMYYRENFHSDILAAILAPDGAHKEQELFLKSFVDFIGELAMEQHKPDVCEKLHNLNIDLEVSVGREIYRTDVAIYSVRDNWSILIENKINDAVDQKRQLIRYLNEWKNDKCNVPPVAIVYLTPSYETVPNMSDWSVEERSDVGDLLVSLAGYRAGKKSLYSWLKQCEMDSVIFNNKAVLAQYAALVKRQAGMDMNEKDIEDFLDQIRDSHICIENLLNTINRLPRFYAIWLQKRVQTELGWGDKSWIWQEIVFVLDFHILHDGKRTNFAFDIPCGNLDGWGITCFPRSEELKDMDLLMAVLQEQGYAFNHETKRWHKYCCKSKYPTMPELEEVWAELRKTVEAIKTACK